MTMETFTATVAIIGIVILVASLLSGVVEKTGVPQVAIFLLLGATLGPYGLDVFNLALESPALRVIATLAWCSCCSATRSRSTSARSVAIPGSRG
jgi:Kef-type K+ transport system membrane component KefB